jgi:prolyl oligopeptidase
MVFPVVSQDDRWLCLTEGKSLTPTTIRRRPLPYDPAGEWETVLDGEGPDHLVGVHGGETLVLSFRGASAGRLLGLGPGERVLYAAPDDEPLAGAHHVGADVVLVAHPLEGTRLTVVSLDDGAVRRRVTLPPHLVLHDADALDDRELALDLEVIGGERTVERATADGLGRLATTAAAPLLVETVWAQSADGTQVPLRIVRRPGDPPRGDARVFLSVYGGYAIPFLATGYAAWHRAWTDAGGVLAYAGVRGGGEFGEAWHEAARREKKQRGIDDLIACAEWFGHHGWSGPGMVALNGMSNGGLMTAAALVQRPDLFGAVVTEVPVADMLNYHRYTAARPWIAEYGDPDDPADREFLAAYSPLHNVDPARRYPPTLVLTADHDDRVPPGPHAYPLAAALRETVAGAVNSFLQVTRNAGHASGRSLGDAVAERSAVLGFAAWGLDQSSSTHTTPTSRKGKQ